MAKYLVQANSTILVDDSGGTPRNISAHVTSISDFGKEVNSIDDTTFADTAESAAAGIELSQGLTIDGFADDTATTGSDTVLNNIVGTIVTVKVYSVASVRSFTAEMLCTKYALSSSMGEFVMFQATFKQDGAVTVGT